MKRKGSFYTKIFAAIVLMFSCFFIQNVSAIGNTKLSYSNLNLTRTTGITTDIEIGEVPSGVTVNGSGSTIVAANSAKISFTSDDGSENDYLYRTIFASRGISITLPVITSYINDVVSAEGITLKHLLELQNVYGYEIGSHTYTHPYLTNISSKGVIFQLTESKRVMTAMGLKVSNVFIPYGAYNEQILDECQKVYRATRVSNSEVNTPLDKRMLNAYWLDEDVTLAQAKTIVDTAAANNQYVIFGFHAAQASQSFMDNTIAVLADYIHTFNNTQIITVNKAIDRIEGVMTSGVDYKIVNNKLILKKFFVRSLPLGDNVLTFKFSDGSTETMTLTIEKVGSIRHNVAITATSLSSGSNLLGPNETITFNATLDTNAVGTKTSTATIGTTTVNGVLNGSSYTYTFNTNNITDGTYNKVTVISNVGANQKTIESAIQLQVQKQIVDSITITKLPTKLTYTEGQALNLAGMIVTANYNGGSSSAITNYTTSGYTSTPGTKTITVTYSGKTATFNVTVNSQVNNPTDNLIPNPSLETVSSNKNLPLSWVTEKYGKNTTKFAYLTTGHTGNRSLKVTISKYVDGDSHFKYAPQPVVPEAEYEFSVYYKATLYPEVYAEIQLADGEYTYLYLGSMPKSTTWNKFTARVTMPLNAVVATVYVTAAAKGYVITDDYSLTRTNPPVPFNRAIVTLCYDELASTVYTNGFPLFKKYNIVGDIYIYTEQLNTAGMMNKTQLDSFRTFGFEIGSHTVTHPYMTTLTATKLTNELKNSQTALSNYFGGIAVPSFASPYGEYNLDVIKEIKKYYQSHRTTDVGFNSKDTFDPYMIKAFSIESDMTPDYVKSLIDKAIEEKTWLVLVFHDIKADDGTGFLWNTTPENMEEILAYLQLKNVATMTTTQALTEIKAQIN